jgi:ABC-type glycerol-3-phosphate transport system substrate-binding protein
MEFIVSDPEVTKVYFQNTGLTPVLRSAYVDEVYANKSVRTFFEQMKAMKKPNIWSSPRYAEAERFFMVAVQKATMKGVDPQKALNEAAENLKILLGG